MNILILNGPNLNFLGIREPDVYGTASYQDLEDYVKEVAKSLDSRIDIFQSNHEGEMIDKIQEVYFRKFDGIIINAGAYAHYSYAIRDAIKSVNINTVEVHLSNVKCREDFRKKSVIEDVCVKSFYGKGFESYKEALIFLKKYTSGDQS
jgi:3-dehydroquinate dehydratase-2